MTTRAQLAKAVDMYFAEAAAAGKVRRARGDYAVAASYRPRDRKLHVGLASGIEIAIPVERLQGLHEARPTQIKDVQLTGGGVALHWPKLDLDISVHNLVVGLLGSKAWMAALGRHAGKAKSRVKAAAARQNGKLGGRPRRPVTSRVDEIEESVD